MDTIAEIFGKRVRAQRKKQGLSQEQLAEKSELHPTYIGQLERGEKNASLETIMSVCRGLDISPSDLFENISRRSEKSVAEQIYELVIEMTDKEQRTVLEIIRKIRELME